VVKGTGNKACFLGPHGDFAKEREQGLFLLQCSPDEGLWVEPFLFKEFSLYL